MELNKFKVIKVDDKIKGNLAVFQQLCQITNNLKCKKNRGCFTLKTTSTEKK
jgi:hypothetical protein